MLLTIVSVQRSAFAAASCGILLNARYDVSCHEKPRVAHRLYLLLLLLAACNWLVQSTALGILLSDVFVQPLAYSTGRAVIGEWTGGGYALFLAVTAASLPVLTGLLQDLLDLHVYEPSEDSSS